MISTPTTRILVGITPDGVARLSVHLKSNKTPLTLDLEGSRIGGSGAVAVAQAPVSNSVLTKPVLGGTQIRSEGAAARAKAAAAKAAAAAAKALGVPPAQIVNSLVFEVGAKTSRQPVLVLAPGDRRVDPKKLAEKLGVSKSKIKSASADACLKYTGFQAGGVGPCGHLVPPWRTFIEELVFEQPSVWCGAGVKPAMMPLTPQQLLQITGADVCKLVVDADE